MEEIRMGKYEIHYSKSMENKSGTTNPILLEMMSDIWKFEIFEAESEQSACNKLFEKYGEERINYVLSITSV
jgi:hypothetical protein